MTMNPETFQELLDRGTATHLRAAPRHRRRRPATAGCGGGAWPRAPRRGLRGRRSAGAGRPCPEAPTTAAATRGSPAPPAGRRRDRSWTPAAPPASLSRLPEALSTPVQRVRATSTADDRRSARIPRSWPRRVGGRLHVGSVLDLAVPLVAGEPRAGLDGVYDAVEAPAGGPVTGWAVGSGCSLTATLRDGCDTWSLSVVDRLGRGRGRSEVRAEGRHLGHRARSDNGYVVFNVLHPFPAGGTVRPPW